MSEWFVYVSDVPNSKRTIYLDEHMNRLPPFIKNGSIVCGGALLDDEGNMCGSHIQFSKKLTKDEVMKILNDDAFARNGVWDMKTLIIRKIHCVVRSALEE